MTEEDLTEAEINAFKEALESPRTRVFSYRVRATLKARSIIKWANWIINADTHVDQWKRDQVNTDQLSFTIYTTMSQHGFLKQWSLLLPISYLITANLPDTPDNALIREIFPKRSEIIRWRPIWSRDIRISFDIRYKPKKVLYFVIMSEFFI